MKNNVPYTVQPLPVNEMQVVLDDGQSNAIVTWSPVEDKLEPTATPTGYVVYTAIDDNGFDQGKYVAEPKFKASIKKDHIYRFKVTAVNEGMNRILSSGLILVSGSASFWSSFHRPYMALPV